MPLSYSIFYLFSLLSIFGYLLFLIFVSTCLIKKKKKRADYLLTKQETYLSKVIPSSRLCLYELRREMWTFNACRGKVCFEEVGKAARTLLRSEVRFLGLSGMRMIKKKKEKRKKRNRQIPRSRSHFLVLSPPETAGV